MPIDQQTGRGMDGRLSMTYWKILRVLLADTCNIQCRYCHNEGQPSRPGTPTVLADTETLLGVFASLGDRGLEEIRFSGGEPTLHPRWLDLVEWVDRHLDVEIGMATNGLRLTRDDVRRVAKTRLRLNIHLPATSDPSYRQVTTVPGFGLLQARLVDLASCGVPFALNYVHEPDDLPRLIEALQMCRRCGHDIKVLPVTTGPRQRGDPRVEVAAAIGAAFPGWTVAEGRVTPTTYAWTLTPSAAANRPIRVKLVEPPCFNLDHAACISYGEIRLLPDLRVQSCILDSPQLGSPQHPAVESVVGAIDEAWAGFTRCPDVSLGGAQMTRAKPLHERQT